MDLKKHKKIFNGISSVYNLFYKSQCRGYAHILDEHIDKLQIPEKGHILDIGCGTGALIQSLSHYGFDVQGVDLAEKMLGHAVKRGLTCRYGNVVEGLGMEDHSFDLVTSAFVAHGLDREKRKRLFQEAARLSRGLVLFHDYSSSRNWFINFIEYMEDGDYFNFVKSGLDEMKELFGSVEVIRIKKFNNWYICRV
ncbi:class I SAM-dependent methyltransferase [Oceanispirochaeta sp.]|jgi:ubiquinone/menaquinone biosynthesis C-methylase UbiE|uniref:class I SAM-dependent DNA methyltransferase n=1 Tax=Oceanispirochaeta sp. TaxID=2035350 RepID=UPI002625A39B|nr:class I SAM-dependent methyltransferase [Oceanispirochaeta sp.]MDA3955954.1 class I SAM-dependent methyltransferase [Oceanispirochaeta sp.]